MTKTQIKIFSETSAKATETAVNEWLATNPNIEILYVTQSESGDSPLSWNLTIAIVHREYRQT